MSTTEVPATFEALGLPQLLLQAIARAGYTAPTPIQAATIPPLLEGRDVLGQAATGTGKTAAFALPILCKLRPGEVKPFQTSALVLVPTRELALQVTESMKKYSDETGARVLAIYGGQDFAVQLRPLKRGVDVVVATPGRAIDHLKRKTLKLDAVRTVVLDEADEMLDMGFAEDLEVLLSALPAQRQVALFSATMPSRILKIAERQMRDPVRISIARTVTHGEGQKVRQVAYVIPRKNKLESLLRVLDLEQPTSALVFCRTRADVDELATVLDEKGFAVDALHGGLSQEQRDRVMKKFKSGSVKYVIATDVAARGIHVDNLSHVINADVPTSPEVYVHRIGRTGRAGREGVAITFADSKEARLIGGLERASGGRIQRLQVPTLAQVQGRKVEETKRRVLEASQQGAGESLIPWLESLGEELVSVAAAAIDLLHTNVHGEAMVAVEAPAEPRAHGAARASAMVHGDAAAHAPSRSSHSEAAAPLARSSAPSRAPQHETSSPPSRSSAPSRAARHDDAAPVSRSSAPSRAAQHDDAAPPSRSSAPSRVAQHEETSPTSRSGAPPHQEFAPSRAARHDAAPSSRSSAPARASASASTSVARVPRASPPPRAMHPADNETPRISLPRGSAPPRAAHAHHAKAPRVSAPRRAGGAGGNASPPRHRRDSAPPERGGPRGVRRDGAPPARRGPGGDVVTLFISAGSHAGIRPGDLVGAIANEAGLSSRDIGPIEIRDMFSLVGVPPASAERVIEALGNTKLRGRKVRVNRERGTRER